MKLLTRVSAFYENNFLSNLAEMSRSCTDNATSQQDLIVLNIFFTRAIMFTRGPTWFLSCSAVVVVNAGFFMSDF
jgi:hypothetical protein